MTATLSYDGGIALWRDDDFAVTVSDVVGLRVIAVTGDVFANGVTAFRDALLWAVSQRPSAHAVLEVGEASFFVGGVYDAIRTAYRTTAAQGGTIRVRGASPLLRRMFVLAGLEELLGAE